MAGAFGNETNPIMPLVSGALGDISNLRAIKNARLEQDVGGLGWAAPIAKTRAYKARNPLVGALHGSMTNYFNPETQQKVKMSKAAREIKDWMKTEGLDPVKDQEKILEKTANVATDLGLMEISEKATAKLAEIESAKAAARMAETKEQRAVAAEGRAVAEEGRKAERFEKEKAGLWDVDQNVPGTKSDLPADARLTMWYADAPQHIKDLHDRVHGPKRAKWTTVVDESGKPLYQVSSDGKRQTDPRAEAERKANAQAYAEDKEKYDRINGQSKEYLTMKQDITDFNNKVDMALVALEQENEIGQRGVTQALSTLMDSNVRAFQNQQVFDVALGDLGQRIYASLGRFVAGDRTDSQKAMIKETLMAYKQNYGQPTLARVKEYSRRRAHASGLPPFAVAPPSSIEEIKNADYIDKRTRAEALIKYFPEVLDQ